MAHGNDKKHGIGGYVIVALILAVITYVEYYIVEFPLSFLSQGQTLFWLIALSVVKFWMVIWYFMHLKDDDKLYTGFFSSGMVIGMGTFVALTYLFLLPGAVAPTANAAELAAKEARKSGIHGGAHGDAHAGDAADSHAAATEAAHGGAATETLVAASNADYDSDLGSQTYGSFCVGCHQPTGSGIPGVFPPLAKHAANLYQAAGGIGGRQYLIDVMLYGLQGPIEIDGATYNGLMPAWANLSDAQVAAVINHTVVGFDATMVPEGFDAIRAEEVAAARNQGLTGAQVHAKRAELGDIPPAGATMVPAPTAAPAEAIAEPVAAPAAAVEWDRALGSSSYASFCVGCHQPTGAGIPGVFPPLANHTDALYAADGGDYLIKVMLYGLQGPISVAGMNYAGMMPAWANLTDAQIAAIINHVVAGWEGVAAPEGFAAITPSAVAERRGLGLSPQAVNEVRATLALE
jgi:mono/diheme cytochrome c family protein/heme/copper-type cytochrome/quinol oxidase subunit 4